MSGGVNVAAVVQVKAPVVSVRVTQVATPTLRLNFGAPGQRGAQGVPGVGEAQQYIAGAALSALRVVTGDADSVRYAEPGEPPIGLTVTAAAGGALVTVAGSDHVVADASWSWTPGEPLFCGAGGVLTQSAPSVGVWQTVGVALSAISIVVRISARVEL